MNRIFKTAIIVTIVVGASALWSYIVNIMPTWMLHTSFACCLGALARFIYNELTEE